MKEMFCDFNGYCKGMSCSKYYECHGLEKKKKKEENKKTLINSKIKVEELEKTSEIIMKKSLKVISCSGSIYALKLLENKDIDTLKDLKQEVSLQIILDNYTITKNAYKVVRKYLYNNYEKNNVELFFDNNNDDDIIDKTVEKNCYISYINENSDGELKKANKIDTKKLYELLSDTEKKIYYYYFINNMKQCKIAEMLELKKQNLTTYIKRIKEKSIKCVV